MGYLNCKKCGGYYELQEGESPKDFDKCQCGGDLEYIENIDDSSLLKKKLSSKNIIRISGILFGASIMLIPYYLYSPTPTPTSTSFVLINIDSFILWVTGGLTAAFIASGKVINGASNGLYAAIISGLIVIIIYYLLLTNNFNNQSPLNNIALFAVLGVVYILIPGIFSIIGGLIGISIRKALNKLI